MKPNKRVLIPVVLVALGAFVVRMAFSREKGGEPPVASGTVEATEAQLGFQLSGLLEHVAVREGDIVRPGAEIARLDVLEMTARREQAAAQAASARAQLGELENGSRREEVAQARAARDGAAERVQDEERDFTRTKRLFEGGAVSREAFDKASTALDVARSQLRQAAEQARLVEAGPRRERIEAQRAQVAQAAAALRAIDASLSRMTIRAPVGGVVAARHREPGEILSPGAPVVTLTNLQDRWVRIYVPERQIGAVKLGARATITSDTYPEKTYPGEVSFIASEAEFTPKTVQTTEERVKLVYAVKVRITGDASHDLKPGMPADVRLTLAPGEPETIVGQRP